MRRAGAICALLARKQFDGADGARTRGLQSATLALSQLSYGPLIGLKCSGEVEIVRPIDPSTLVVSRLDDSQIYGGVIPRNLDGKKEASVQVWAVGRNRVDVRGCVERHTVAVLGASKRFAADDDDAAVQPCPFALHSEKSLVKPEDEVASPALRDGPINLDSELDRGGRDTCLSDSAFPIRCHVRQPSSRLGWAVSGEDNLATGYTEAEGQELATN